jgi:hypothetical protein
VGDTLNKLLQAADPLAREEGLSAIEAQTIRQTVVLAAVETMRPGWLPGSFAVAASVAGALLVGVLAGVRAPGPAQTPQPVAAVHEQRQLQFETPGGTRVVWVLNPALDLPKDRQP